MDARSVVQAVFSGKDRPFGVRLWDGTFIPPHPSGDMPVVALTHERASHAFGIPPSEERLAEAFLDGDLEVEGDLVDFRERAARWPGPEALPATAVAAGLVAGMGARAGELIRSAARHTLARDADAVRYHYDIGNEFYRLFLDEQLVYTTTFWPPGVDRLELAAVAKLELVCRKLGLKPGQRLLDVGCGWGPLMVHATRAHGAHATGISLSDPQIEAVRDRMKTVLPPGGFADVRHQDWRQLPTDERWDAMASIEMMEHVGREQLDRYFGTLAQHLVPGGLFLNESIAESDDQRTVPWLQRTHGGFIQQEIFPDTDRAPLELVIAAAQRSGFEVLDVEAMRPHYVRTLREWLGRLERRFTEASQLVGKRKARAYRLYLASSLVSFSTGRNTVFQVLLRKQDGADAPVLDRGAWYRDLVPRG